MQKWRQSETADGEEWQLALEREAVIRPLASKSKLPRGSHRGGNAAASIEQNRVLRSIAPLQAAATNFFPSSLEERTGI
jgi:hypothetical protein